MTTYYTEDELRELGLKAYGRGVKLSRHATLYSPEKLILGDNVRIDDQCIITGDVWIGSHIHIAAGCYLFGGEGITLRDFTALSGRVCVYSGSDDYTGEALFIPNVPEQYRKVEKGGVLLHPFAVVGAGSILLPGTVMEPGAALGAMSLAKGWLAGHTIYGGVPAKRLRARGMGYIEKADAFLCEWTKENQ